MTEVIKSLLKVAIKLERHLGASSDKLWADRASYSNGFKAKTAQICVDKTVGRSKSLEIELIKSLCRHLLGRQVGRQQINRMAEDTGSDGKRSKTSLFLPPPTKGPKEGTLLAASADCDDGVQSEFQDHET